MEKMGVLFICVIMYVIFIFISSPFLFVFGDDRVIRYMGADDDTSEVEDAHATEWGITGNKARNFYYVFLFYLEHWNL